MYLTFRTRWLAVNRKIIIEKDLELYCRLASFRDYALQEVLVWDFNKFIPKD